MNFKSNKGFTLIELLVVIAIIATLSSVVLASLNSARTKANDAKRLADRRTIYTALNAFYADNGYWPSSGGDWSCFGKTSAERCWNSSYTGSDTIKTQMDPYLPTTPTPNADIGNLANDAYLYHSFVPGGSFYSTSPAGAWLIWYSENTMTTAVCKSPAIPPVKYDKYWYCYDFVGAP